MTTYIGSNTVQHKCDWHKGCNEVTTIEFFLNNSIEKDEFFRSKGWYISLVDDKCYCPKHSPYNVDRDLD